MKILKHHLNHDFPNRNDSFGCHIIADDLSNTFSFPVTRHKSLLVQILKILKLKFENFKTSFKAWFPESKWFFWMSYYRWWPIKYSFNSRYAAQVFACSNLKVLKLKFENFKTSFKPWFPESKWFFWMSYYRWWPIKYIFNSRYAAQVFASSNFKDFKIEIWKF